MGYFVLHAHDREPAGFTDFSAQSARNGFSPVRALTAGDARIALFANQSGTDPQILTRPDGDFLIAFGLFLFRGQTGGDALGDFYDRFSPDRFDWSGLVGQHVLLIRKQGVLHLITDGLGASRIFHDAAGRLASNSFVAMAALAAPKHLDRQAVYEYVFAGACYGRKTLFRGIEGSPPNRLYRWTGARLEGDDRPCPITDRRWPRSIPIEEIARVHAGRIDSVLGPLAREYGPRIRVSYSGGFDSRLILATLLKHGVKPTLFSYGPAGDPDVEVARHVAEAEGLAFDHIDKSLVADPPPDGFAEAVERNLFAFDGWRSNSGLLTNTADLEDRLRRHLDGCLPVNGSLGEIYRNFFHLRDGRFTAPDIVSVFFSGYHAKSGGPLFDDHAYRANLAREILLSIGAEDGRLDRADVERIYSHFRGRYWTGHDARINQRFGHMAFPFLEHRIISDTAAIPLRHKNIGRLQSRLIEEQFPRLLNHPSAYSFPLHGPRPLRARLADAIDNGRPVVVRRLTYRLKARRADPRPPLLTQPYLSRIIDVERPYTRRLFNSDAVTDPAQRNAILTVEYLAQRYGLELP